MKCFENNDISRILFPKCESGESKRATRSDERRRHKMLVINSRLADADNQYQRRLKMKTTPEINNNRRPEEGEGDTNRTKTTMLLAATIARL